MDTYSLVAKLTTIQVLLALAAQNNWTLHQMDPKKAFLHGDHAEEIYMLPPEGYAVPKGKVLKLK